MPKHDVNAIEKLLIDILRYNSLQTTILLI